MTHPSQPSDSAPSEPAQVCWRTSISVGRSSRSSFTLIELLVVIAIIAVLAAMLLPVLGKARALSKRTVCMSQQKQLGLGVTMYADDFEGYVPPMAGDAGSAASLRFQHMSSSDAVRVSTNYYPGTVFERTAGITELYNQGYARSPSVFYCPADGTEFGTGAQKASVWAKTTIDSTAKTKLGYMYTGGINTLTPDKSIYQAPLNGLNEYNQTAYANGRGVIMPWTLARLDEAKPTRSNMVTRAFGVLAMDMAYDNEPFATLEKGKFSHERNGGVDGINVLFDDGHVQWFDMQGAFWPGRYGLGTNQWWGDVWVSGPGEVKGLRY